VETATNERTVCRQVRQLEASGVFEKNSGGFSDSILKIDQVARFIRHTFQNYQIETWVVVVCARPLQTQ
jgi:hypothetical protein